MLGNDWDIILDDEIKKDSFKELINRINCEYSQKQIFPSKEDIFKAFRLTSYKNTKVVILGQDPYHGGTDSLSVQARLQKFPLLREPQYHHQENKRELPQPRIVKISVQPGTVYEWQAACHQ